MPIQIDEDKNDVNDEGANEEISEKNYIWRRRIRN